MSITKSYNKHTGIYYAYDTTYEWDEERQKKIQHKRCIGKYDPVTGEIIPNGKVGRPSKTICPSRNSEQDKQQISSCNKTDVGALTDHCEKIEYILSQLSSEISCLKNEINRIRSLNE
ncbi:MAG: hypothetical protein LUG99_01785 [Lachnospiraceae bacterium]|nr:hypothetical protein [Lachnospiraceae bacterium]